MVRMIKIRLMYSFWGILAGGTALWAILQILSWILTKAFLTPVYILRLFVMISFAVTLFLSVCSNALFRHEGFRFRNAVGAALGLSWVAGNLLSLILAGTFREVRLFGGFLEIFGCYVDFLISGVLFMALLAAKHKPVLSNVS